MACYKLAEAALLERSVLILKRPTIRCSPPTTIRPAVPPTSYIPCSSPVDQRVKLKSHLYSYAIVDSHNFTPNGGVFTTTDTNRLTLVRYIINPARRQKWKQYPYYLPASAHSFGVKSEQRDPQHVFVFHLHLEHKPIYSKHHLNRPSYLSLSLSHTTQHSTFDKHHNDYPALAVNSTLLSDDSSLKLFKECYGSDKPNINNLQLSESVVQNMMTPGNGQRSVEKPTSAQLSFVLLKLREEVCLCVCVCVFKFTHDV